MDNYPRCCGFMSSVDKMKHRAMDCGVPMASAFANVGGVSEGRVLQEPWLALRSRGPARCGSYSVRKRGGTIRGCRRVSSEFRACHMSYFL